MPQVNVDNGSNNYTATAQIIDYFQQEYTGKVEHKFTDKVSLTGFYLYNRTNEPCSDYFEPGLNGANRFADPNDYLLQRRPQILALNNTWILSDTSVLALRFGYTKFVDNSTMTVGFDPATLGFSQTFLNQVTQTGGPKFPSGTLNGGYSAFGAILPSYRTYNSSGVNGSYSKFVGTHTFKMGADYRKIGVNLLNPGSSSGTFQFDKEFTSSTGLNNNSTTEGNSIASFLLGYPTADAARPSTMTLDQPSRHLQQLLRRLLAGRLARELEVHTQLWVTHRARGRHARSEQQFHRRVRHDGDQRALERHHSNHHRSDGRDAGPLGSRRADVRRRQRQFDAARQSAEGQVVAARRRRLLDQFDDRAARRLRPLLGTVGNDPVPSNATSNYGQIGYTNNTVSPQTAGTPTVSLTNPFPSGLVAAASNSLGLLSGVGTQISYVDQNRTAPRVRQYSADLQRELPGAMAITLSYIGAHGDHLPLGGLNDTVVNINQLDPNTWRSARPC